MSRCRLHRGGRLIYERVEHGLQIECRAADELEQVRRCALLLAGFSEFAGKSVDLFSQLGDGALLAARGAWRIGALGLRSVVNRTFAALRLVVLRRLT